MRCLYILTLALLLILNVFAGPASARDLCPLVRDGKAQSVILIPETPEKDEVLAAQELQEHVRKISGTTLEIQNVSPDVAARAADELKATGQIPIVLGQLAVTSGLGDEIRTRCTDKASFVLKAETGRVQIAGASPEGTLFGIYELLEQLGVRWFMPGELGTVIPQSKTLTLRAQDTVQNPSFTGRWDNAGVYFAEWGRRMRMGGPYFPPAHGLPGITRNDFETHPDYFALIGGKREPRQLDVSNPEVIRIVTEAVRKYFRQKPEAPWIGMGPDDGSGFCECERCRALDGGDWDPFSNEESMTDRYLWFFNQILDGIKDEFPGKKIAFYAYHSYMRPPVKTKPNPLIVPALAPIALCRIHGMNNPICPERSYYATLMRRWGEIQPEVYERGYWFNLADPGFPFSSVHRLRDEIPAAHKFGIKGWRVETMHHWASETPSLYIAARLMWDYNANVDTLLADFYSKFFGPAEKPMAAYLTMMDAALRDADFHTGSSFDTPHFYPAALRTKARRQLDEAARLTKPGVYRERVKLFRASFDMLDAFIDMQAHQSTFDFEQARRSLDKLDSLQKYLMAQDPPMINKTVAPLYLKRFFRQSVEQGYARTHNGNELVAPLKDEWSFLLDQLKIGEDIGLWKADIRGGNWQKLKTSSASWSDQGLRTYKGEAWYRQEVDIPQRFAGKRIFLWFGGVDEKAKVWVNGQFIGISHDATFLPFELDATPAIKAGAHNIVTVRVVNERVDELGTGGIIGPVMFYAPAAGAAAKLENIEALPRTFP